MASLTFVFVIESYLVREDFRLILLSHLTVKLCNLFVLDGANERLELKWHGKVKKNERSC